MAKSGTIVATAGSQTGFAAVAAVAQSDPRVSNLASVAKDALTAYAAGAGLVFIDTANRRVNVTADVEGVRDLIDALTVADIITLTKEEDGATVPWIVASGDDSDIAAELAEKKPRFSVPSLISTVEDVLAAKGKDAIIIIDQANEVVMVYEDSPSNVDTQGDTLNTALAASSGALRLALFTQTVDETTGPKPFGE